MKAKIVQSFDIFHGFVLAVFVFVLTFMIVTTLTIPVDYLSNGEVFRNIFGIQVNYKELIKKVDK